MKKNIFAYLRFSLVLCCCVLLSVASLQAQMPSLSGRVTVSGGENNALATIRIVDQGIGTTSKLDGTYYLEDITPGAHTVEYSFIGHKTVTQKISWSMGEAKTFDVVMEEAPIMLAAAFVTPTGEDPATYILKQVWKNAEQKYATMPAFDAKTLGVLSYSDFEIYEFLPSILRGTIMTLATVAGMRTFVKMLSKYPNLDVALSSDLHYRNKKYTADHNRIARCNVELTADEQKALIKLTSDADDLYAMAYGSGNKFRSKKVKAELKGSYEDGDKLIYVIEGKNGDERCEMHVVEGTWDMIKLETHDSMSHDQMELRKGPGGLYLPVSHNAKLIFNEMSAQEFKDKIASEMEKAEADPKAAQKAEKSAEKMKKKLDKDEEKSVKLKAFYERLQQQGMHIVLNVGESFIY